MREGELAARQLSWAWRGPWGILAAASSNTNGLLSYPQCDVGNLSVKNREQQTRASAVFDLEKEEEENWYSQWLQVRTWFVEHWQEYVPVDIGDTEK